MPNELQNIRQFEINNLADRLNAHEAQGRDLMADIFARAKQAEKLSPSTRRALTSGTIAVNAALKTLHNVCAIAVCEIGLTVPAVPTTRSGGGGDKDED